MENSVFQFYVSFNQTCFAGVSGVQVCLKDTT